MQKTAHGWQFSRDEYVVNWHPSSNKVRVQYRLPGHGETVPFVKSGQPGQPRIVVALGELLQLVQAENRPRFPLAEVQS